MGHSATVGVIATKGGSGKSTLIAHLSVEAARAGFRTLVIDCDEGQNSLCVWAQAIRSAAAPVVRAGTRETVAAMIAEGRSEGFELVFIDTPARGGQLVNRVASLVEHVLVPVRGTTFDLQALANTIDLLATTVDATRPEALQVRNALEKSAIVLNGLPSRAPDRLIQDIEGALAQCGAGKLEIAGTLRERAAYTSALAKGFGVTELGKDVEAVKEIDGLFRKLRARVRAREAALQKLPPKLRQTIDR